MRFETLNPWWKGKEYIEDDKHIKEFVEKKYKWKSPLLQRLKLNPNNIFSLRGPRQIGKTTFIKLLIKNLLSKEKIDEKSIFFLNCDELIDFRELASILREYLAFSKEYDLKNKYLFLDEISRVKNWQKSIKALKDSGELNNCFLMLTGSHTLDIKYGIERLPGRTGKEGKDILILPLTFSEYVELIKPEIAIKIKKIEKLIIKDINNKINNARIFDSDLKILFKHYLITGGFPLVINEYFANKKIPEYVYELYFRWVVGDIVKWGKQEKILIQLMSSIINKQSTPVSWDSLAKDAEIKSHKTVSVYVEDLENMFVLLTLYYLELNKKIPDYNKNKKIYFFDPFIYHVFNKKINFKEYEINPDIVEAVVISNLARLTYTGLFPSIYYWKNKKEVDAIVKVKNEIFPFEVKYQNKISKQDYKGLYYFNKGILVTKDTLIKGEKYSAIPAHLLLAIF
ncbi:ATP-binding protein [Candidatus Pacearchaeota archaeon]|nr:ATP-binding protein [Candidatus Pacearchaeota archaeon]